MDTDGSGADARLADTDRQTDRQTDNYKQQETIDINKYLQRSESKYPTRKSRVFL